MWRKTASIVVVLLLVAGLAGPACDSGTPSRLVTAPYLLLGNLGKGAPTTPTPLGDCQAGQGNGDLEGTLVDPYDYVDEGDLGSGQAVFRFCGEELWVGQRSIQARLDDPEFGDWYVGLIGDFYSTSGLYVVIQVEGGLIGANQTVEIDNAGAGAFLVDGNFETILAYATRGSIGFTRIGQNVGDPMGLTFDGDFELYEEIDPDPDCRGYAEAWFEVVVDGMWKEDGTGTREGYGSFHVTLGDQEYDGGESASAYLYEDCWDTEGCDPNLEIFIGDSYGASGHSLYLQVTGDGFGQPGDVGTMYTAWAVLYDANYNVVAQSESAGFVDAWTPFPSVGDLFSGAFYGEVEGDCEPDPDPCEELYGQGRGVFDTWLNRNQGTWASFIGTGHVQVALDDGSLLDIGDHARATVAEYGYDDCVCEPCDPDAGENCVCDCGPGYQDRTLTIEIGDLTYTESGLVLTLTLPFDLALEGGEIYLGEYGSAWAVITDAYGYGEIAHAVSGVLEFNEMGGQDGDLVIGHFDAQFQRVCDDPQPECEQLTSEIHTSIEAPLDAYQSTPITITVGYIDPYFWFDAPLEVPAYADISTWIDDQEGGGGVAVQIYGDMAGVSGGAWLTLPMDLYRDGAFIEFDTQSDWYGPYGEYWVDAYDFGVYGWGRLGGTLHVVEDGLDGGPANIEVYVGDLTFCDDGWVEGDRPAGPAN